MIFGKFWRAIKAQFNKLANFLRGIDPIAEMQYECDVAIKKANDGRLGLEKQRGLVERVKRQLSDNSKQVAELKGNVAAYLQAGDRATAGKFAMALQAAEKQLAENTAQLALHETAYTNNVIKLQAVADKIEDVRQRIKQYDADLRISKAEAEIAKVAAGLNFDITTDFGQAEAQVQDQIDQNRGAVRVAADLSRQGLADIQHDQAVKSQLAEEALKRFETADAVAITK